MINNIIIRRLTENDINDFFSLRLESLQNSPSSFLSSYEEDKNAGSEFFKRSLTSNDFKNVIFGAYIKDKLAGIVGIYQGHSAKAAHKSHLWGMYVQPDCRKYGLGKKLLEAAIKHAKEVMRSLLIDLSVETTSVAAKNLYESYGFKIWGIEIKAMRINQQFYDLFHMSLLF